MVGLTWPAWGVYCTKWRLCGPVFASCVWYTWLVPSTCRANLVHFEGYIELDNASRDPFLPGVFDTPGWKLQLKAMIEPVLGLRKTNYPGKRIRDIWEQTYKSTDRKAHMRAHMRAHKWKHTYESRHTRAHICKHTYASRHMGAHWWDHRGEHTHI